MRKAGLLANGEACYMASNEDLRLRALHLALPSFNFASAWSAVSDVVGPPAAKATEGINEAASPAPAKPRKPRRPRLTSQTIHIENPPSSVSKHKATLTGCIVNFIDEQQTYQKTKVFHDCVISPKNCSDQKNADMRDSPRNRAVTIMN
jgi:hypothetical protein